MYITAAVMIGSAIYAGINKSKAAKEAAEQARKIGGLNYDEYMRMAGVEGELGQKSIMNMVEKQAQHKGMVEGMYSKSGVLMTGTPAQAMEKMQEDFEYNVDQAQESVAERIRRIEHSAKLSLMGAEARASGYDEQAKGDMVNAGFGVAKGAMQMYSGWSGAPDTSAGYGGSQTNTPVDYGSFNPTMNTINSASTLKGFEYGSGYGSQLKGFGY